MPASGEAAAAAGGAGLLGGLRAVLQLLREPLACAGDALLHLPQSQAGAHVAVCCALRAAVQMPAAGLLAPLQRPAAVAHAAAGAGTLEVPGCGSLMVDQSLEEADGSMQSRAGAACYPQGSVKVDS